MLASALGGVSILPRSMSIGVDWDFGVRRHGWKLGARTGQHPAVGPCAGRAGAGGLDRPGWAGGTEDRGAARADRVLAGIGGNREARLAQQAAYQAFAILTMCRALYTLDIGEQATKPQAARWAGEALGKPWRDHIGWALQHRHDFTPHDPTMAHEFIDHVLKLARDR